MGWSEIAAYGGGGRKVIAFFDRPILQCIRQAFRVQPLIDLVSVIGISAGGVGAVLVEVSAVIQIVIVRVSAFAAFLAEIIAIVAVADSVREAVAVEVAAVLAVIAAVGVRGITLPVV